MRDGAGAPSEACAGVTRPLLTVKIVNIICGLLDGRLEPLVECREQPLPAGLFEARCQALCQAGLGL